MLNYLEGCYVLFDFGIPIDVYAKTKKELLLKVLNHTRRQVDMVDEDVIRLMDYSVVSLFVTTFNRIKSFPLSKYPIRVWTPDDDDHDTINTITVKAIPEEYVYGRGPVTICTFVES